MQAALLRLGRRRRTGLLGLRPDLRLTLRRPFTGSPRRAVAPSAGLDGRDEVGLADALDGFTNERHGRLPRQLSVAALCGRRALVQVRPRALREGGAVALQQASQPPRLRGQERQRVA